MDSDNSDYSDEIEEDSLFATYTTETDADDFEQVPYLNMSSAFCKAITKEF